MCIRDRKKAAPTPNSHTGFDINAVCASSAKSFLALFTKPVALPSSATAVTGDAIVVDVADSDVASVDVAPPAAMVAINSKPGFFNSLLGAVMIFLINFQTVDPANHQFRHFSRDRLFGQFFITKRRGRLTIQSCDVC